MKLCEAIEKLKSGSKITRTPWRDGVYFKMVNSEVKSYQPKLTNFIYDESILVSTGWLVDGYKDEMSFGEITPFLQQGFKAKLNKWNDAYIFLQKQTNTLAFYTMEVFPFIPNFESFIENDWIEL